MIDAIPSEDIVGQPGTLSRYLAVLKYMTKKYLDKFAYLRIIS